MSDFQACKLKNYELHHNDLEFGGLDMACLHGSPEWTRGVPCLVKSRLWK
jgi:hypothetical protein